MISIPPWCCAHEYGKLLDQFGMVASMSRRGNCYDNAPMESFWGLLKNELVHHRHFKTRAEAIQAITEYIERVKGAVVKFKIQADILRSIGDHGFP